MISLNFSTKRYRNATNLFITADNLAVCVFYRRYVRISKCTADESQNQRTFTNTTGSENDHPVVVALLGHPY